MNEADMPPAPIADCPVSASRNWHAWVDKMPGPGATMTLNISGEVDMPTPGYAVVLKAGPADRMMPPGLRFKLEATPPDGMVTQVITPTQVSYREATSYAKIREILIGCGDGTLATIPDVTITE
ncbi:MAG: hypothetical protein IE933_09655 [Sphingomonadales bacterium]|nr:hypothetical protein [Sphingomonadales bacterium]MBD3774697.1 hypothetical protein [Paracoccaceae bacterium]